jgi:aspartyl-tRNA(Asn)/glutamyl-tRNA(Gln) amidotransferase subunit A
MPALADWRRDVADIEAIADRTATGMAAAYRSGEAGPVEVVECLLERIERSRDDNIFITVMPERARREAEASERRHRAGRPLSQLDGVPIGWKDLFDVAGAPTTAGSRVLGEGDIKTRDVGVTANAARIGMVTLGKLNMTEFAYSGLGLNPHYGTPVNPNSRDVARSPGGSSSGSGASVAARLLPCAVGSDTGGSVRIPASYNGVVGYKTSQGRLDTTGVVPLARSYDTVGPLARSVEDCILLDRALRGTVGAELVRADLSGLTLVVPTNHVTVTLQDAVAEAFERSLAALATAGVTIRREKVDALDQVVDLTARHGTLTAAEAYFEFQALIDGSRVDEIDRRVVRRIMDGKRMSAHDVIAIQRGRTALMAALRTQLGGALLAWPTTPITAPEVAPLEASDDTFHRVNLLTLRNTMPGNVLDLCCVAMPNGRDAAGMPTSLLVSACHGEDERLLGAAIEIERVIGEAE